MVKYLLKGVFVMTGTYGNGGKKCYLYLRVSTAMQVDGYSLEAQEERLRRRADYEGMIIAGIYCDGGKSGKNIEGRPEFMRMISDIESKKDNVSFVLVFKLSRFGRNAADVLVSLRRMQKYGVNLICDHESIDSSKDSGKLMLTILSAVAEIERENILVQTMEGRKQKARNGRWNGGFAPYGYKLKDGKLEVAEDEKGLIQEIFRLYVKEGLGVNGVARVLNERGVTKKIRQNGTQEEINISFVRGVLENPVYDGKIAYGRRKHQLKEGSDYEYETVKPEEYILVDGEHEALIEHDIWIEACRLRKETGGQKKQKYNFGRRHLLSGIIKCPVCGAGMYGNVNRKKYKGSDEIYSEYYYYQCKHRKPATGVKKCDYNLQWKQDMINEAVETIIYRLVHEQDFKDSLKSKIGAKIDTSEIDNELDSYKKQLQKAQHNKDRYIEKQNTLDLDDRHYDRKMQDYERQIESFYGMIEDIEITIASLEQRKTSIRRQAITIDNIYKYLLYFDKAYDKLSDNEKRVILENLIEAVHIYPERQPNGQILKRIDFKFPISYNGEEVGALCWDKDGHVETVCLLSNRKPDTKVRIDVDLEDYYRIKDAKKNQN